MGMPIAVAFAKKAKVIGYDLNEKKIELYKSGIDPTNEVGNEGVKLTKENILNCLLLLPYCDVQFRAVQSF